MTQVSEHISLKEAIRSQTASRLGISNDPTEEHLASMKITAEKVFEPVRKALNRPIIVSSFYRSPKLNTAIGGSKTSQHCKGEAIDIDTGVFNNEVFYWIKNNLVFDQLIWEFGDTKEPSWVHVSYSVNGNRGQILRAYSENGKTKYIPFDL
jgi:zinc D-Ala-D-Ala carboxypeptidase